MHETQRQHRIAELEDALVDLERQLINLHQAAPDVSVSPPPPPKPPEFVGPPPPIAPSARQSEHRPAVAERPRFGRAEQWLRLSGITMVVAAAVFFVSTAIQRGWVGPTAQLVIATVVSLGMIASSFRLDGRRPWQLTFAVGGAAALFASGVVGHVGLEILAYPIAIGWLGVSVITFLVLALAHRSQIPAIASVPAACVGVLLFGGDERFDPVTLAVLALGYCLVMVAFTHGRGWSIARTLGCSFGAAASTVGIVLAISDDVSDGGAWALGLSTTLIAVLAAASQAVDFRVHEPEDLADSRRPPLASLLEARVAALMIPWVSVIWAALVDHVELHSLEPGWTVLAVTAVLATVVVMLRSRLPLTMQLLHGVAAISTSAIAVVTLLQGPGLLAVLLSQAVLAGALAVRFRSLEMIAIATMLGTTVAAGTTLLVTRGTFVAGLDIGESLVVLLVAIVAVGGAHLLRTNELWSDAWSIPWFIALGWASATFRDVAQGQMIVTLVWVAIGTAMAVLGGRIADRRVLYAGLTTLFLAAAKLVFVDLAAVDVLWRAALFFAVGAVFLRVAFVLPTLTKSISDLDGGPLGEGESVEVGAR